MHNVTIELNIPTLRMKLTAQQAGMLRVALSECATVWADSMTIIVTCDLEALNDVRSVLNRFGVK